MDGKKGSRIGFLEAADKELYGGGKRDEYVTSIPADDMEDDDMSGSRGGHDDGVHASSIVDAARRAVGAPSALIKEIQSSGSTQEEDDSMLNELRERHGSGLANTRVGDRESSVRSV